MGKMTDDGTGERPRLRLRVKMSLEGDGGKVFFGPGVLELLRDVRETGSIQRAARKMGLSYVKALKILRQTLHETADVAAGFDSLVLAYLSFDMDVLTEMLADTTLPDNFDKVLVEKRNKTMYKGFRKLAKKQRVFCAVGTAHLPGDKGLIGLLRKKGYTVEPVRFEWNVER